MTKVSDKEKKKQKEHTVGGMRIFNTRPKNHKDAVETPSQKKARQRKQSANAILKKLDAARKVKPA